MQESAVNAGGTSSAASSAQPDVVASDSGSPPGGTTTPPSPSAPEVSAGRASSVSSSAATLTAIVNPNGAAVSDCELQWGTDTTYDQGRPVSCRPMPGDGTSAVEVSVQLDGLAPRTTYHYRFVAQNSAGPTYGADTSFTTLAATPAARKVRTVSSTTAPRLLCSASATRSCRINGTTRVVAVRRNARRARIRAYLYTTAGIALTGARVAVTDGRRTFTVRTGADGIVTLSVSASGATTITLRFARTKAYVPTALRLRIRRLSRHH